MASNKSKSIGRRSATKNVSATETDIVLVGTYRDKQLDWIGKNNIYHYPVTDKDGAVDGCGGRGSTALPDGGRIAGRAGCPQPVPAAGRRAK